VCAGFGDLPNHLSIGTALFFSLSPSLLSLLSQAGTGLLFQSGTGLASLLSVPFLFLSLLLSASLPGSLPCVGGGAVLLLAGAVDHCVGCSPRVGPDLSGTAELSLEGSIASGSGATHADRGVAVAVGGA
jgi:hypothetical protein